MDECRIILRRNFCSSILRRSCTHSRCKQSIRKWKKSSWLAHNNAHHQTTLTASPASTAFGGMGGRRRGGPTMTAGHRGCAEERRTGIRIGYTCKNYHSALGQQGNIQSYEQTSTLLKASTRIACLHHVTRLPPPLVLHIASLYCNTSLRHIASFYLIT